MSVRIIAWKGAQPADCPNGRHCDAEMHVYAHHVAFPQSFEGLRTGCYLVADRRSAPFEIGDFAYSGYGAWRETLTAFVHGVHPRVIWGDRETYTGTAFVDLIDFADNEGCIGPAALARLERDFRAWSRAVHADTDACSADFISAYDQWQAGIRHALSEPTGMVEYR